MNPIDPNDPMAGLTEQDLQTLSTLGDRQDLLQEQLARAEALRNRQYGDHTTGAGGLGGAIAQGLSGIGGGIMAHIARGKLQDNINAAAAPRSRYSMAVLQAIARANALRQQPNGITGLNDGGIVGRQNPGQMFGLSQLQNPGLGDG